MILEVIADIVIVIGIGIVLLVGTATLLDRRLNRARREQERNARAVLNEAARIISTEIIRISTEREDHS